MSVTISTAHKFDLEHYEVNAQALIEKFNNGFDSLERSLEKGLAGIARAMWLDGYSDVDIAKVLGKSGKGVGGKWVARGIAYHAGLDGHAVAQQIEQTGNAVTVKSIRDKAKKFKGGELTQALESLGVADKAQASTREGKGNQRTAVEVAQGYADKILAMYDKDKITRDELLDIIGMLDKQV